MEEVAMCSKIVFFGVFGKHPKWNANLSLKDV